MATLKIPERLGKYPIIGVAGKGAMGVVFKGMDPVIKRPVAIKTMRRELLEEDDHTATDSLSSRFQREAQAAGALNHPGIVSVYEYGEDASYAYIAMEYVEGSNLRDYMASGTKFDEQDTVSIMAQLLDALHYAHANAVWHRDIKPANIIVMSNGRIKLGDFGIARLESAERTRTSVVMGTPGYIAPELYLGGAVDHRIDIFAAGVIFYQLLSRRSPFRGGPEAIMHDVCYHDPAPASSVDPERRWPQYDAIAARAIAKAPADRFASAGEFRAAILEAYAQPVANTISERTIISHQTRRVPLAPAGVASIPPAPSPADGPKSTSAASPSAPPPTGWSAVVLAGVELELARFVGPVGKVLVRRAAKAHKDLDSLVQALLPALEAPADREKFSRAVLGRSSGFGRSGFGASQFATPTPTRTTGGGPVLSAQDLEQATKLLVRYIGPIGKIVAKRAAVEGVTREAFYAAVLNSIDGDDTRERFLREAGVV
ncbi:MAG: serine/threonine-protein kinase [Burkholderiaceae bacterium]